MEMGYVLCVASNGFRSYTHSHPNDLIFLHFVDGRIPLSGLEQSLEASGVNLDTFHAALEARVG